MPRDQICAICGKRPATTRDHVPPRGIFAEPRPRDLITVPACLFCNHGYSKEDEAFRVYLSLHVGSDTQTTRNLWKDQALGTLKHNRRLRRTILESVRTTDLTTKSGLIYGQGFTVPWDSNVHDKVIERIIRGLHFHHFGEILPSDVQVKVHWLKELPPEFVDAAQPLATNSIADGDFAYRYQRSASDPKQSIWLFQFYRRHWASGYTIPRATP
jgi:hypothetical protein